VVEGIGEGVVVGISKDLRVGMYLARDLSPSFVCWEKRQRSQGKDALRDANLNDEEFVEESDPKHSHFEELYS